MTPDYEKEFDMCVDRYNDWLTSLEDHLEKPQSLLRGVGSLLGFFGAASMYRLRNYYPLHLVRDLTPAQRDAIALGSDWKRVELTLDKVISGERADISIEEAKSGKNIVQQTYESLRKLYAAHARK